MPRHCFLCARNCPAVRFGDCPTIERPKPVPSAARDAPGSNTRSRSSGAIPRPLSSIAKPSGVGTTRRYLGGVTPLSSPDVRSSRPGPCVTALMRGSRTVEVAARGRLASHGGGFQHCVAGFDVPAVVATSRCRPPARRLQRSLSVAVRMSSESDSIRSLGGRRYARRRLGREFELAAGDGKRRPQVVGQQDANSSSRSFWRSSRRSRSRRSVTSRPTPRPRHVRRPPEEPAR